MSVDYRNIKPRQIRRGTSTYLTSTNPTLKSGELCLETDTNKLKVGDGRTSWTSLDYLTSGGGGDNSYTPAEPDYWLGESPPANLSAAVDYLAKQGYFGYSDSSFEIMNDDETTISFANATTPQTLFFTDIAVGTTLHIPDPSPDFYGYKWTIYSAITNTGNVNVFSNESLVTSVFPGTVATIFGYWDSVSETDMWYAPNTLPMAEKVVRIVGPTSNLSHPRPSAEVVYWLYQSGSDIGVDGVNIVNKSPQDLYYEESGS